MKRTESKKKSLLGVKGIFKDTEKDLDEVAAYVSNVVTGDFLSYTVSLAHCGSLVDWCAHSGMCLAGFTGSNLLQRDGPGGGGEV